MVPPEPVSSREAPAVDARVAQLPVSDALAQMLWDLGVRQAFGLTGGAIGPICNSLGRSPLQVIHCRHEGGAAFAALEASFASGRPVALFATTGPGLTNAITGLQAARWEGGKIVVVSGATSAPHRGRWATQETSAYTNPAGLYASGELFHLAHVVEDPAEFQVLAARLSAGFARPNGFIAHVTVPVNVQSRPTAPVHVPTGGHATVACDERSIEQISALVSEAPTLLWVGFGARGATAEVRTLADALGCPVVCSPRAKGIFPETDPQFLGVTGLGGHPEVDQYLADHRPDYVLVLGTRLGEPTSFWQPSFVPKKAFIHVDLDPTVPGAAFPSATTFAVQAEIGEFTRRLIARLPAAKPRPRPVVRRALPPPLVARPDELIRPRFVLEALQRVVVEGSDALVLTESGNAFAWGNNALVFNQPRYRVSTGYGSMGHVTAGVVGAALGRRSKAVALVGDGSMLMNSEVSTAVQYSAPAVWVVLNDGLYGMVHAGMSAQGFTPVETLLPQTDFSLIARGMGADAEVVREETELDAALERALAAHGPYVLDVRVDPSEPGPWLKRIQTLILQGARGPAEVR